MKSILVGVQIFCDRQIVFHLHIILSCKKWFRSQWHVDVGLAIDIAVHHALHRVEQGNSGHRVFPVTQSFATSLLQAKNFLKEAIALCTKGPLTEHMKGDLKAYLDLGL